MLKALQLGNFKSWREVDVPLAPITGFFGTNSSGKSSLLQALLLMKQSAENSDQQQPINLGNEKTIIQLGNFNTISWNNSNKPISISLEWERFLHFLGKNMKTGEIQKHPNNPLRDMLKSTEYNLISLKKEEIFDYMKSLKFSFEFSTDEVDRIVIDNQKIFFENLVFSVFYKNHNKANFEFKGQIKNTIDNSEIEIKPLGSYSFQKFNFSRIIEAFDETNTGIPINSILNFLRKILLNVYYLGPLRDFPKSLYGWSGNQPSDVGYRGEKTIEALLSSRLNNLPAYFGVGSAIGETPLEVYIAQSLSKLGLISSFKIRELSPGTGVYAVKVKLTPESPEVSLTDVGFGVSQVLPVLVLCYYVPEGSTILLEQPELHLHPSVQSGLADIFIDAYQKRRVQIILESHSEHLLRRLQRRIAEEVILPTDVNLYFCSLEKGESKLEALQLDSFGNIHNYPKDFFGDDFGEIAAMTKAAMERKKAISSS